MRIFQKMVPFVMPKIPEDANTDLDHPITMQELREPLKKGKRNKSPGPVGICHEIFKQMWDIVKKDLLVIINNMYMEGSVSGAQNHGYIFAYQEQESQQARKNIDPSTSSIQTTNYLLES